MTKRILSVLAVAALMAAATLPAWAAPGSGRGQQTFPPRHPRVLRPLDRGRPPMRHVAAWWDLRGEPNVLFVHYNDLKADLDREMRRVAAFLNIGIPAARWPVVVDGCTFESMRADADKVGNFDRAFEGGAKSFLFKGVNGRWREVLTEGELRRYRHRVEELLAPEAARWLEHGSLLAGSRVHESVPLTVAPAGACRSFWRPRWARVLLAASARGDRGAARPHRGAARAGPDRGAAGRDRGGTTSGSARRARRSSTRP